MTISRLFRRHYAITAIVVVLFVVLGVAASHVFMRFVPKPNFPAPVMFARIIDHLNQTDRVEAIKELSEMSVSSPFKFSLLDETGNLIYPKNEQFSLPKDFVLPGEPYGHTNVERSFGPGPPVNTVIRLKGEPVQYLFVGFKRPKGPNPVKFLFASFGFVVISILIGIGIALYLMFRSVRERMVLADSVISELKSGNLKARFPIKRMDEVGALMERFNQMAEEIEHLVDGIRRTESSRMNLLQELAHDLRTPIASLKNLVENGADGNLDAGTRSELLDLANKEIDYVERLVEDLLVLAQVSEPKYNPQNKPVILNEILSDEAESVESKFDSEKEIRLELKMPESQVKIMGDVHLLRRLFRNAIDNAFSFADKNVVVTLEGTKEGGARILVTDDGPGLSEEQIKQFGEKRESRTITTGNTKRVSVGLGSFIMKRITSLHRGKLTIKNRPETGGAQVEIQLPK